MRSLTVVIALLVLSWIGLWVWFIWQCQAIVSTELMVSDEMYVQDTLITFYLGLGLLALSTLMLVLLLLSYRRLLRSREVRTTRIEDLLETLGTTLGAVREASGTQLKHLHEEDWDQAKELGSYIHTHSMQTEQIIAQLQSNRPELDLEITTRPLELTRLLKDCIRDMGIQYEGAEKLISLHIHPEDLTIDLDPYYMKTALLHLLDNAIRYNREAEAFHVEVEAKLIGKRLQLSISDNGIGVAHRHIQYLGTRYFRADVPKDGPMGLGLGLHQTREVIAAHGGEIQFSGDRTAGFSVEMSLPLEQGISS